MAAGIDTPRLAWRATRGLPLPGYRVLVANKTEPWRQTVSRLLGPEGLLVGVTYTPDLRTAG